VASVGELEAAGFLDLLEPGAVVVVEWADRLPEALPSDRLELRIERPEGRAGSTRRVLHARASGKTSQATLARWREALAAPDPGASGAANRGASNQTRSDAS
jgi:tRNA threonylcarbamoyladenosine biosynthesis protein TsaE